MTLKMPKPVYQILLGAFLLAFVVIACNNKKDDKAKETTTDSIAPTTPPAVVDSTKKVGDSIIDKPVDPGTVPKTDGSN